MDNVVERQYRENSWRQLDHQRSTEQEPIERIAVSLRPAADRYIGIRRS